MKRLAIRAVLGFVASFAVACGGGDSSDFSGDEANGSSPSGGSNGNGSEGSGGSFESTGETSIDGATSPSAPGTVTNSCATTHAGLSGKPHNIVLVLDRSSSMNDAMSSGGQSKWSGIQSAFKSFFGSDESTSITIDIIPFPQTSDRNIAGCDQTPYQSPAPNLSATLPDTSGGFTNAFASIPVNGGTPTNGAMQGAIAYATALKKKLAGKSDVSIVLATDGLPTGCLGSGGDFIDADTVAKTVKAAQSVVKTYVVGIGDQLDSLNKIAVAGGTGKAFLITGASSSLPKELTKTLAAIRSAAVGCTYNLPTPPAGKTLDVNQVNVVYETDSGKKLVKYSADCSDSNGWRYDNKDAPTQIMLCTSACGTVKAAQVTSLDVVLGCETNSPGAVIN